MNVSTVHVNGHHHDGQPEKEDGARRLVQKLVVTLLVGGVVYVLTDVLSLSQDEQWKVILAVLCSGAALIIQYMFTFSRQLGELGDVVEKRFADIGQATKLFNEVEKLRDDGVTRLASSATQVVSKGPKILHKFVNAEISRVASHMEKLTNLNANCEGENHDWMLTLTECAEVSIDAISTSVDRDFWDTEPAGRYLKAQREAITKRGVTVRRLFIVKSPDEVRSLDSLCKEQRDHGIQVRVVSVAALPRIRRGRTIDFIVFDQAMAYEIAPDLMDVNSGTRVSARESDVQPLVQRFTELWNASPEGSPNGALANVPEADAT